MSHEKLTAKKPSPPRIAHPHRHRLTLAALLLAVALAGGCAGSDSPEPSTPGESARSGSAASGSVSPDEARTSAAPRTPRAMEIAAVEWPTRFSGAKALLQQMPAKLPGLRLRERGSGGGMAGAVYRGAGREAQALVTGPTRELRNPTSALAATFGLVYACKKGSYAGTAPQSPWGGPDADRNWTFDANGDLWWFSCTIAGAEGQPKLRGQALGWVSGELAWLLVTPDRRTTQVLVTAMSRAGMNEER